MNYILFLLLFACFIFYLFMGLYSYQIAKKSKVNTAFIVLCISTSIWALGYAIMLISPDINSANCWRLLASLGACFFNPIWITFAVSLRSPNHKGFSLKVKAFLYIPSIIFFISDMISPLPAVLVRQTYGWADTFSTTDFGVVFNIYFPIYFIIGLVIIFLWGRDSGKNRIKKQTRIILITTSVSFIIGVTTDIILPTMGIVIYNLAIITVSIGMSGVWYAISKHRLMSITPGFASEYIFKEVNQPIFIVDEDFLIKNCNEATLNLTGYSEIDLIERSLRSLINEENFDIHIIMEKGYMDNIEVNLPRNNKDSLACELSGTVIYDEYKDLLGIVILLHDISERKKIAEMQERYNLELENKIAERTLRLEESNKMLKNEIRERKIAEEKIRHSTYYDILTELPNRKKMLEYINKLIMDNNSEFAVLFVDLDDFKSINDNYGHQAGDYILSMVAERFKGMFRTMDLVSRIGGDEFIIILRGMQSSVNAEKIAKDINRLLYPAFTYKQNKVYIGASIGISLFPEHGTDVDTLIRNADLAMYEVKRNGGYGYHVYTDEIDSKTIDKLSIKMKLNNAISNNEFISYYQPVIDLQSMQIVSAESLIRWKQGDVIIPPMEFIPIAKNIGAIDAIDNWMLHNACSQCKQWHDMGMNSFTISVNTSYKQLKQGAFVKSVINTLDNYGLDPMYLNLEITEDEAMEDLELIIKTLTELKSYGIKISLDDFGTGYSSLSNVSKLPIDVIKIDRSLVENIEIDSKNILIVNMIIVMAHSLGLKVVAEGVENEEQLNILKDFQCDLIQGYLIGKPMDRLAFEEKFIKLTNPQNIRR